MERCMKQICGFAVQAVDGEIGKVYDLFFDDQSWNIRYLVVETGDWLLSRKVLLSPVVVENLDWEARTFNVHLTQSQVERSPDIDTAKPVSRQHERALYQYYTWLPYWNTTGTVPLVMLPIEEEITAVDDQLTDPHLRSMREVIGYHIRALDDEIGHVEDFVASDAAWLITYLLIDTRNLLPGRRVLVPPAWVDSISWADRKVNVGAPRDSIEQSPAVHISEAVSADQEQAVSAYYEALRSGLPTARIRSE
jgi:hypothetical protein